MITRMKVQFPYVAILLVCAYLFYKTTQFGFDAPGGRIGPDVWPKAILGLAMLTCAYGIVKGLLFHGSGREVAAVLRSVVEQAPADQFVDDAQLLRQAFPQLLIAGAVMTVAYALLVDKLGFFLCTVLFLAGFTWVGRYRRLGVIVATSLIGSFVFMFMFMKIVYVSLPLGVGPFEKLSILLMKAMGIH